MDILSGQKTRYLDDVGFGTSPVGRDATVTMQDVVSAHVAGYNLEFRRPVKPY